ncbi:MAG: PAS domain-containing protein [Phycisphaerae bacterium]|nr:PAS domain-containing protein [Phycisphaerae bacterium]
MIDLHSKMKHTAADRFIGPFMRDMGIRHKIVSVVMSTCVVALVAVGVAFSVFQHINARQDLIKTLQTQAAILSDNCQAAINSKNPAEAKTILAAFHAQSSVAYACIFEVNGGIFAEYKHKDAIVAPLVTRATLREEYLFVDNFLVVSKPIIDHSDRKTIGLLSVWSDLTPVRAVAQRDLITMGTALLIALLVAYLMSFKVRGIIAAPVLQLVQVAKTASDQKQYSIRANKESDDELGVLADSFNELLTQIQVRDVALDDASEDLEARVEERTTELKESNRLLTLEMEYRKKAQRSQKERTERIIRHQATLLHLDKLYESELDHVLVSTTEELAKTLQVDRVGVWLKEANSSEITCEDLYILARDSHESGMSLHTNDFPKYFQAIEASRILAADDAAKDIRTAEYYEAYLKPQGIHSLMSVPIRLHGKLVGLICHEQLEKSREWTLEEQDFAASVADMIMLKLETQERRRAELALRESEHRYRTLLQNIPQKIFYKDLNSRYLLCNESYARDLHINPDEIYGKTDFDFFSKTLADKYLADEKRIMQTGLPEEIEEPYSLNGKTLIVQTMKSPVRNEEGEIIGLFSIFWDITARKEAEKNQVQLNKDLKATVNELKRSNMELQDFAYVTAHDLKAPLRAIGTLTDWVYADYRDAFDDQGREQMELVKGRVSRMNELIDSILKYSEIGRGSRNARTLDLNDLLHETLTAMAPPEHIEVVIETSLPTLTVERVRMIEIFQHLIGNAIKYLDKDRGLIQIGCQDKEDVWEFSIRDNGPGIDAKYHEKIFKIFQTLVPRDELESTGIGLAVVKKVVELYGGQVWVESKVGQGSTFYFTLLKELTCRPQKQIADVLGK